MSHGPGSPPGAVVFDVPAAISGWCVAGGIELAEAIAAFPQDTLRSDREAVLAARGLPLADGLALEARLGRGRIATALEGARRFAGPE